MEKNLFSFEVKAKDGKAVSLKQYEGKVVLVVNVASKCGFTPQYTGLEEIYKKFKDRGFVILGFPSNHSDLKNLVPTMKSKNFAN